jgi:chaperonin GroES
MNVQPLKDFVVVKKEDSASTSPGGLHLVSTVEEKLFTGVVLSVGPGVRNDAGVLLPVVVKVGDKVCFDRNAAVEVKSDGEKVLLVKEAHLLCTLS